MPVIIALVMWLVYCYQYQTPAPALEPYHPPGPMTCIDSKAFECMCGDQAFPLLINGTAVKLGPKRFTQREINELKTLNGASKNTTYEIF